MSKIYTYISPKKKTDVNIPSKTSDLVNDSGFITINDISNIKVVDTLVTTEIVNNTLTLTTDKYQTTTMIDGTTINLPTVTDFTEIHLFFSTDSDLTLILPSGVKYQRTPIINANKSYEFIFTYANEWLCGFIECSNQEVM